LDLIDEMMLRFDDSIYSDGLIAKLHPSGNRIYGADNGRSPDDIHRLDLNNNLVSDSNDSQYHGDYDVCGDLWISDSGYDAVTACGDVFRLSEFLEEDMFYGGSLSHLSGVTHLDNSPVDADIAVIPATPQWSYEPSSVGDNVLQIYDSEFYTFINSRKLPTFFVNRTTYTAKGKFVFYSTDGQQLYVVVQAAPESGLLNDFAVWTTPVVIEGDATLQASFDNGYFRIVGDTIFWYGSDTYRVYDSVTYEIVCEGGTQCQVPGGTYDISNTTTGDYWSEISVKFANPIGVQPGTGDLSQEYIVTDYQVADAEYSDALDRMAIVSSGPNQLTLLGGYPMQQEHLALNLKPLSVSISPDGLTAVVGHDGWISHIDLTSRSLIRMVPISAAAADIVLDGGGYAHVVPEQDQWTNLHSVYLENEDETLSRYALIYADIRIKLHPGGQYLYAVDDYLERFDISDFPVTDGFTNYSDSSACEDLWLGEDGRRIFTQCGNVYRSTPGSDEDMSYNGSLSELTRVVYVDHSTIADSVAVIPRSAEWWEEDSTDTDEQIQFYGYQFLDYRGALDIPKISVERNGRSDLISARGEYVFYSTGADRLFAIVKADSDAGLKNDYAIWSLEAP